MPHIVAALAAHWPEAKPELLHDSALQLLVATILSAQCTDDRVNLVTRSLFRKYRTAADFAAASAATFEKEIHSTGFFRNKTKSVLGMARMLVDRFGGEVPSTMEELVQLPGVARKTANCVLSGWFGKAEGVVVDTHIHRLSNRLGWCRTTDPKKTEQALMKIIPQPDWREFSFRGVFHGRYICTARKPKCGECRLAPWCPSAAI